MAFKKFKRQTTLNEYSMLHFGKHVGKTCGDVADLDPEYILWLDTNKDYTISESLRIKAEEVKEWANQRDFEYYKEMDNVFFE